VAILAQPLGEAAAGATEVEDPLGGCVAERVDDDRVRGVLALLQLVLATDRHPLVRAEPHLGEPVLDDVTDHVARVLHPVDVADLVAVVGRDRDLDDPLPLIQELDDDLVSKSKSSVLFSNGILVSAATL
jgi:hypothetical protein